MNSFSTDGRGWSDRQLLLGGTVLLLIAALITGALVAKSQGLLENRVAVTARLDNVGDGLPQRADVKFRGVLVGEVSAVQPAGDDQPNIVSIALKPDAAREIPDTVTARVVPSNVFAVSSIQLVDNGAGAPLRSGAVIAEDTELPAVLFQSTIDRMRNIAAATERGPDDPAVGIINLLTEATNGRGNKLLASGSKLQRILTEFNALTAPGSEGPSTLSAWQDMAEGLGTSLPEVVDAMEPATVPLRTIAEKQDQLNAVLAAGLHTAGTASTALENHTDQMIEISTHLEPVVGVFAMNEDKVVPIGTRLKTLSDTFFEHGWNAEGQRLKIDVVVAFSPMRTYVRKDCPRYGQLEGPSCHTAPETPRRYAQPKVLVPGSYAAPPDLAPPADTPIPADPTAPTDPAAPADIAASADAPAPGADTPAPADAPAPGSDTPAPADIPAPGVVAPASFGGTVGPVGSATERAQLSKILGEPAGTAQQLLLGPVARGTEVTISPVSNGGGIR